MNANLWVVLGTALFCGLSTGIYELVLPLFLKGQGIRFDQMGLIFGLAGCMMVLARIYMGGLSDRWSRKHLYSLALGVCGITTGLSPTLSGWVAQIMLKMLRDTAALTRDTIFPIILYEEQRAAFLNFIGKFRGIEYLLQAGGTLLAGVIIAQMGDETAGFRVALYVGGGLLLAATLWWMLGFYEHRQPSSQRIMALRELFSFDLHPNLRLILISGALFSIGVQLSHSFYLPIFFNARFGIPGATVAIILVIHRITIGLPMLIVGNLPIKNLRCWYVWGLIIEGITMAVCAVTPHFLASASIFLLHDLVGAGIWVPIQAMLIQRYSRDATRGIEVGKVLAWTSIGSIIGPLIAGKLAMYSPIYPFFASGLVMMLAAIPLFWLNLAKAPTASGHPVDAMA